VFVQINHDPATFAEEPQVLHLIENEVALRRTRSSYLPGDLLGEPAWDTLLVLYLAALQGESMNLGTLGERIGTIEPETRRCIERLNNRVLVRYRQLGGSVSISDRGRRVIDQIFAANAQGGPVDFVPGAADE
jgi:hypothetical protein